MAGNGQVWVTESHARSAYTLTPSKQVVATLPGDPNGPSGPEDAVAEADANGDLIAGFGPVSFPFGAPVEPDAPRDWFRVTPGGGVTALFSTTNSYIVWLKRDPSTGDILWHRYFRPGQDDRELTLSKLVSAPAGRPECCERNCHLH